MLCPLNRVLLTDGKLLYNCCEFKELRGNEIKTEHPEIAVVGVIGEQKEIEKNGFGNFYSRNAC